MAKRSVIQVTPSSGNVFGDLGFAEPEEEIAKAQRASHIQDIIERGWLRHRHRHANPCQSDLVNKFNNTLNHHGGTIVLPTAAAKQFDHEIELVIVFGRRVPQPVRSDALGHVAGYFRPGDICSPARRTE